MNHYLFFVGQLYDFPILRPLQAAIRARGDHAAWYLHGIDKNNLRADEEHLSTVPEVKTYNPIAVYVPTNWVPDFFPGVKVEIFHGLANDATGKKGHYRIRGLFDLYCTHARESTLIFEQLATRYKTFHVVETGWPKVDPLFKDDAIDTSAYLPTNEKPVILYASTFSPSLSTAALLPETIARLSKKGDWHWLVTLHPKMDEEIVTKYRALAGPNLQFVESNQDLKPLLKAADAMLCDTSSISLEFMLLDKPVVTLRTKVPGPHVIDVQQPDEIEQALATALKRPAELMQNTRKYMDALHFFRDGCSSERVLEATDEFIRQYADNLKPKPLNLFRKFQIRKRMHYYQFR
ncbi:MAG: CDP-glycerol glycerophosphotransferase family protein [Gammaproteobacteria bacterium]|jgi:CDP-glycerol glycerophosphotransferase (TagB/SpsB family)|nr:CDP-glycerol glycerophosphotransferase family protein [Gammaproteobacteria bacterium]MCZ6881576.1 CDP-glycerol glycerophosphotransferase family protein [Gammaproteobacteria bacterium]